MESESHSGFSETVPMKQNRGVLRHLDTRNPAQWRFSVNKSIWFIFGAMIFFPLLIGICVFHAALFFLLFVIIILAFTLKELLPVPVFDFDHQCFYRDWRKPKYGDVTRLKDHLPLSQVAGLQFLYKIVSGGKGSLRQCYELNLITLDQKRIFVTDSSNKTALYKEAELLAEKLKVPLHENKGEELKIKKTPLWLGIIVLVIFSGFGLFFFSMQVLIPLTQHLLSQSWPRTDAYVLESSVVSERRSKGKGRGSYTVYRALIRYKYYFKGKEYTSDRNSFFQDNFTRSANYQHRIVRNMPPGKKISCFINPEKPSEAILSRKVPQAGLWMNGIFSMAFFVLGIVVFFSIKKRSKR